MASLRRQRHSRRNSRRQQSRRQRHSRRNSSRQQSRRQQRRNQRGGGRTIDIPLPDGTIPGPSYNSAVTIGEACNGPHCAIPVTPSTDAMMANLGSAVPGANINYPGTDRMGNNAFSMPGISPYTGTELNSGPFQMLTQAGGSRRRRSSRRRRN
jgi:hypothetical protein